jgi:hypothetical protein
MQAKYMNLSDYNGLSLGDTVETGEVIGHTAEYLEKGLLEISLYKSTDCNECATDFSNSVLVDPADYFILPYMDSSYLSEPMSARLDSPPPQAISLNSQSDDDEDYEKAVLYAQNEGLDEEEPENLQNGPILHIDPDLHQTSRIYLKRLVEIFRAISINMNNFFIGKRR